MIKVQKYYLSNNPRPSPTSPRIQLLTNLLLIAHQVSHTFGLRVIDKELNFLSITLNPNEYALLAADQQAALAR